VTALSHSIAGKKITPKPKPSPRRAWRCVFPRSLARKRRGNAVLHASRRQKEYLVRFCASRRQINRWISHAVRFVE
jgi:hypothetical protein